MAWSAPRTWTTSEIVTAAMMNQDVRDNTIYLKSQTDLIPNCSHSEVTGSRALDTNYQYTGGGFLFVSVTVEDLGTAHWHVHGYIGSSSPASTAVDEDDGDTDSNKDVGHVKFFVPNDYYYRVYEGVGGNFNLTDWHEWDFHV